MVLFKFSARSVLKRVRALIIREPLATVRPFETYGISEFVFFNPNEDFSPWRLAELDDIL